MKYLAIALGVSIALGLVLFGIAYPLLKNAEMAEGLAALPIVGSHHIADMLERQEARRSLAPDRATSISTLKGYEIAWYALAAYGTVILVAVVQFAGGIVGLIMGIVTAGSQQDLGQNGIAAVAVVSIPVQLIGAFFVGRWIGTRSAPRAGLAAVFAVAAATAILSRAIDLSTMASADIKAAYGDISVGSFLGLCIMSFVIFGASGLLGYWRGTLRRQSGYMSYLLGVLPADTRDTLVNLAYEEAEKVGRTAPAAPNPRPAHA